MSLFIGRQPILDQNTVTYGYELLFRDGVVNAFQARDGDQATSKVIDNGFFNIELDPLTRGHKSFVNFTESLLKGEYWRLLPADRVVIELLENVNPDLEIIESCRHLKNAGYTLALDDFSYTPAWEPLVDLADIIKFDLGSMSIPEAEKAIRQFQGRGVRFLAEFVEDVTTFKHMKELGCTLFQGYFFSKPQVIERHQINPSKLSKMHLMECANRADIDFGEITEIMKGDPALTTRLLKYVNSAAMGVRHQIGSIRQALAMIGASNLRKWISILLMADFSEDKPLELTRQAIIRGRMSELLAEELHFGRDSSELFLTGLFSLMDVAFNTNMETLVPELPLSEEIKDTLLGDSTSYTPILELNRKLEQGAWSRVDGLLQELRIERAVLKEQYRSAIDWAENFIHL